MTPNEYLFIKTMLLAITQPFLFERWIFDKFQLLFRKVYLFIMAEKMSCSWQNAFTAIVRTLYWFIIYLFERLANEKINIKISIILLYFKCLTKTMFVFKKGGECVAYVIPNLALRFFNFQVIAITRLFNVITYNNNLTVQSRLPIFFVLNMTKHTQIKYSKFLTDELHCAKVFKVISEQKTFFFTPFVVSDFAFFHKLNFSLIYR